MMVMITKTQLTSTANAAAMGSCRIKSMLPVSAVVDSAAVDMMV